MMNLARELRSLMESRKNPPPQVESWLFEQVRDSCVLQAKDGRSTLNYVWDRLIQPNDWEETHRIRETVVRVLQNEGPEAEGFPKVYPLNKLWNEWTEEYDPPEVKHSIVVRW